MCVASVSSDANKPDLGSTDFKNLQDPSDTSFKPHPKDYPFVELEYPNTHSSER